MYWALHTSLSSALRSDAEQLPYQAVKQPVLSMHACLKEEQHGYTVQRGEEQRRRNTLVGSTLEGKWQLYRTHP
jgi:hypothetical protein